MEERLYKKNSPALQFYVYGGHSMPYRFYKFHEI